MKGKKLSAEEQLVLRESARLALARLETLLENQSVTELLDRFKNRFNLCETVYKVILAEHQKRKGKKNDTYLKVDMKQVPHALNFAGYNFEKSNLNELFGSSGENGTTVKKLRDAVTHGMDPKAVREIVARREELFSYMDNFLNTIRTFDQIAA